MREPLRKHPPLLMAVAMVVAIVAAPTVAQEELADEGVLIPDMSGDLLDYYTYQPIDEGLAYMDLLSVSLTVDGEDLVVRFELNDAVPADPIATIYILNVDRDADLSADITVVLGLGGRGADGVLWDNVSGEPVLLDAPVIADRAITGRVPLEAFGPFEGATAQAQASAEWLADPDDIFSGVHVADPAPGLDEAWLPLDALAGLVSPDEA